jgi:hypothetical protein
MYDAGFEPANHKGIALKAIGFDHSPNHTWCALFLTLYHKLIYYILDFFDLRFLGFFTDGSSTGISRLSFSILTSLISEIGSVDD